LDTHFDPFEEIAIETYSKEELKQLLLDGQLQHAVQHAAIYQAMHRLNWISW